MGSHRVLWDGTGYALDGYEGLLVGEGRHVLGQRSRRSDRQGGPAAGARVFPIRWRGRTGRSTSAALKNGDESNWFGP